MTGCVACCCDTSDRHHHFWCLLPRPNRVFLIKSKRRERREFAFLWFDHRTPSVFKVTQRTAQTAVRSRLCMLSPVSPRTLHEAPRIRSRSCSPTHYPRITTPGTPLRTEFNASLTSSYENSLKSTMSPHHSQSSPISQSTTDLQPNEPYWMDKVMEMLDTAQKHSESKLNALVGPALPTFMTTLESKVELQAMETNEKKPPLSPRLLPREPATAQILRHQAKDCQAQKERVALPSLPTFTTAQKNSENVMSPSIKRQSTKIVLEERTCRAMCGPGHSGDFVETAPVPTCAKNKSFQFDIRLLAEGDWRGPLAACRGSDVYKTASAVVAAAYRMAMQESARKVDVLDR